MSKMKSSVLDKRIAQFFENTTELLTDIHARNKAGAKSTSTKKRKVQKPLSIPESEIDTLDPDFETRDEEVYG